MPKKSPRRRRRLDENANDPEDLLKMIGSSSNPDKKPLSQECQTLLHAVGRSYTETGRFEGETDGDNLLAAIGQSQADMACKAVGSVPDAARVAAQVQAEAEARHRQYEEDQGGYPCDFSVDPTVNMH